MPENIDEVHRSARANRLKPNAVGLVGVAFMAIATAAPITAITSNLPIMAGLGTGVGSPAGFLIATLVLSIFSVGFVAISRHITTAGAFYGFISRGLGRVIGLGSGLLITMSYMVFEAVMVALFGVFAKETVAAQLGIDAPWWVYGFFLVAVIGILTYFEIEFTAKVLGIALVAEILILGGIAVAVLLNGGGPDGIPMAPLNPAEAFAGPSVGLGLFFAFWCWVGFESTALYGEESKNPRRTIPIATFIVVIGVGLFYAFVSWMIMSGNGIEQSIALAGSSDPFETVFAPAREYLGDWAVVIFRWLLLTGTFACGMAFHNCAARYLYALGRERILPGALSRTHPRHGSPWSASLFQSAAVVVITVCFLISGLDPYVGQYTLMAILGTMGILVIQTICSIAVIAFFWRNPDKRPNILVWLVAPAIGAAAMVGVVLLLVVNMDTAAGGPAASTLLFRLIPWIVGTVFLLGCLIALRLRSVAPERYALIGHLGSASPEETSPAASRRSDSLDPDPVG